MLFNKGLNYAASCQYQLVWRELFLWLFKYAHCPEITRDCIYTKISDFIGKRSLNTNI